MSAHGAGSPATGSLSNKRGMCPKACQPSVQATLRLPTTGGGGGPAAAGPFFLDSSASLFTSTSFSYLQHVQQSVGWGWGQHAGLQVLHAGALALQQHRECHWKPLLCRSKSPGCILK